LGFSQLGDRWENEVKALNEQAEVVLRVNALKTSKDNLISDLAAENIGAETVMGFSDALVLQKRQNVFKSVHFKEGSFEVMDAASQTIAPFLNVEPGMRIIDACAGGGGKTLHVAALSKNKGRIVALDPEQWKLDELTKRARRAGAFNIECRVIDSNKVIKRLENTADRLLLDVPCSGLGVLKRNPDAKWKLSTDFIKNVNALQKKIINDYEIMLKAGGEMVYSTCSLLFLENEEVIKDFLNTHSNFKLVDEKRCWPSEGFDGFYMARLKKT
jgi:16S rRNA (cytosine967-C5)-methyltransferase